MNRIIRTISLLTFPLFILHCAPNSEEKKAELLQTNSPIFYPSHEPGRANKPFSDAVQVGNLYFLTGQIGLDHSTGNMVAGGIESETIQTLENIKDVLKQHDLEMTDVVKATVILDTIADFVAFNSIYESYFPQKPVRTTFAVESLARNAKIEIEVIAAKDQNMQ
ncbi:MAG: RidA family protein [Bacteroidia bacterium]|nr:RidA family protein [Bacteroidia bacterium]NNF31122.1 RidA family protein [Flavobacteriaceae bacterium]NNJ81512.1 RidA family protein [Flavobacteriaceae bacterium]NNK55584.1 RidA family protein [Flavobacteriaceae bacterium]NNM08874.1 RidA family protein [Flavobacteriaceae bacterium]